MFRLLPDSKLIHRNTQAPEVLRALRAKTKRISPRWSAQTIWESDSVWETLSNELGYPNPPSAAQCRNLYFYWLWTDPQTKIDAERKLMTRFTKDLGNIAKKSAHRTSRQTLSDGQHRQRSRIPTTSVEYIVVKRVSPAENPVRKNASRWVLLIVHAFRLYLLSSTLPVRFRMS